jgi:voltage-gated potassium channel
MLAAIVFLGAYTWEVVGDLHGTKRHLAEILIWATWGIFLVDYLANLLLAPKRWYWFRTHLLEFFIVMLPMLRPLRLLRLLTLLNVLQRTAGAAFRGSVVVYVAGASLLLVFVAALAVLDVERSAPGANLTGFGDAIWWAVVTMTTVGYGDYAPVTGLGRLIAAVLMLSGIALLGVVTATLASWIVERISAQEQGSQAATQSQITDLSRQLDELQDTLDRSTA